VGSDQQDQAASHDCPLYFLHGWIGARSSAA
jgi:hypothetical protein